MGDLYGLGPVSTSEIQGYGEWLVRNGGVRRQGVTPKVASDYKSRLRRALRITTFDGLTPGVQRDLDTAVKAFVAYRGH